jgi:A/G-specific adenine glycosylase
MKDIDRISTIDIEECVSSKRLYHSDQYHVVLNDEKIRIQKHLLEWYQAEKRTNMPWRKDNDKTCDKEVCDHIS